MKKLWLCFLIIILFISSCELNEPADDEIYYCAVSGYVTDRYDSEVLPGAVVEVDSISIEVDSNGYFSSLVSHKGSFNISVHCSDYTQYTETINTTSNIINRDIELNYDGYITAISGFITSDDLLEPIQGSIITTSNSYTETNDEGNYVMIVRHQGEFDLLVTKYNYESYTETIETTVEVLNKNITLNYTGTRPEESETPMDKVTTISGVIISNDQLEGIEGVIVVAGNSYTQTDTAGGYSLTLEHDGDFDILISKHNYNAYTETVVTTDENLNKNVTLSYTGTRPEEPVVEYTSFGGNVYYTGTMIPVPGVTIECGNQSTTTDLTGEYSLSNIRVGDNLVLASKENYNLYSRNHILTNEAINIIDIDLTSVNSTSLSGIITTSTHGIPVVGAKVVIMNPDNTESTLQDYTDINGYYQLPTPPQGLVTVSVSSLDYTNFTEDVFIYNSNKTRYMSFLTYRVLYNGNQNTDGLVPSDLIEYSSLSNLVISEQGTLVRENYFFSHWNTSEDGLGISYYPGDSLTVGESNITLYAQWISSVKSVSSGFDHSFILRYDSTLWATGQNRSGQFGDGTNVDKYTPVQVMSNVKSVSSGSFHTMMIKNDGTLWATGDNGDGQLGDGTNENKYTPVQIMSNVKSVSSSHSHTMIIKNDGTLWATGYNGNGELGDGTNEDKYTPVQIMSDVKSVSSGYSHTMIIKNDGTLWATGSNINGKLGDGTNEGKYTPVQIMSDVKSVSSGYSHTMIIKNDGTLWATGHNGNGQLGDGTNERKYTPVQIMSDVQSVSSGYFHTMIIKNDGTLWATGYNEDGQLGDGTNENKYTPVHIMSNIKSVSSGTGHTMIIENDGILWATGDNNYGQLGDSTTEGKTTLVQIYP